MKSIEVKTTQNVVLEYELAELRDRVVAFIIDLAILVFSITILSIIGFTGFQLRESAASIFSILLTACFFLYSLVIENLNNGQSLGKMIMKIQVIKTIGGQATFADYAARWVFRLVDIWLSFGGVASILVASSNKAQRIGDLVANTAVIKLTPRVYVKLSDILAIRSQESYKPMYIQAKQLEEEHVLLIKTTLERSRQYKNIAHQEAVHSLAEKMRTALGVSSLAQNDTQFLQTVLNDYVVLTR